MRELTQAARMLMVWDGRKRSEYIDAMQAFRHGLGDYDQGKDGFHVSDVEADGTANLIRRLTRVDDVAAIDAVLG